MLRRVPIRYCKHTIWFCKIQSSVSRSGCAMVTNTSQMLTVRGILFIMPICLWSGTGTQLKNWVLVHYSTDQRYAFIVLIIFQHLLHCLCSAIFLLTWLFLSDEIHVTLQLSHASSYLNIRTQQRIFPVSNCIPVSEMWKTHQQKCPPPSLCDWLPYCLVWPYCMTILKADDATSKLMHNYEML